MLMDILTKHILFAKINYIWNLIQIMLFFQCQINTAQNMKYVILF